MAKRLLFISALALLTACSSVRQVPIVTQSQEVVTSRDTVTYLVHDSIYIHDKGDTIIMKEYHTRWRDKVVERYDTVAKVVQLPPQKYVPKFYKECTKGFFILLLVIVLRIAILIYCRR